MSTPLNEKIVLTSLQNFLKSASQSKGKTFEQNTNLFNAGILDSLQIVAIVSFIEKEFGCQLNYEDLTEENLATLASISNLILRKQTAKPY